MKERTSRRRGRRSRFRPFALVALFALLVLTAGLAWAASWRGFRPGHVEVIGNTRVATGRILAVAAIDPHVNIWLQSSGGIAARVLRIRSIAHVSVNRSLPNRVALVVSQRVPEARLVAGDGSCAVDSRGYLFPLQQKDETLPAIVAKRRNCSTRRLPPASRTMRLLSVLQRADAAGVPLATLTLDRYEEERGSLADGTLLYIGDGTQLERKFDEVQALKKRLHSTWAHIKALDLRAPSTPVVVEGKKVEGDGLPVINATKGRGTRAPHRSPVKISSSHWYGVSKSPRSGGPPRGSSPTHSASSP